MAQAPRPKPTPRQGSLPYTSPQDLVDQQAALMGESPLGEAHNQALAEPFRAQLQTMQTQINEFPDLRERLANGESLEAVHAEALRRFQSNSVPISAPPPEPPKGPL